MKMELFICLLRQMLFLLNNNGNVACTFLRYRSDDFIAGAMGIRKKKSHAVIKSMYHVRDVGRVSLTKEN